ncbi:ACT domain-containing protein [Desulfitobacterium sp.]|uniref:ACT domain-containing protein n=1 Tax=Desulfitobacterium sp. TaxID=49981 RepID=UPI002B1F48B8|nr:ACT domain-containing protein [Desulfitobacterium sp.]MEA4900307.1 ACT domain-containing protein [Desulfitobacterium sp.]
MLIEQISVFLENKSGRLADVAKILEDQKINIRALTIADTTDFGILRLIVDQPKKAEKILLESGFTVRTTDVIAVEISDEPGGIVIPLKILQEANVDIEYMYAFASKSNDKAFVILKVGDYERVIEALIRQNIKILNSQEVYQTEPGH